MVSWNIGRDFGQYFETETKHKIETKRIKMLSWPKRNETWMNNFVRQNEMISSLIKIVYENDNNRPKKLMHWTICPRLATAQSLASLFTLVKLFSFLWHWHLSRLCVIELGPQNVEPIGERLGLGLLLFQLGLRLRQLFLHLVGRLVAGPGVESVHTEKIICFVLIVCFTSDHQTCGVYLRLYMSRVHTNHDI